MRRIIVGVLWFALLYLLVCMVIGAVAGGMATANIQPGQDAAAIGRQAGAAAVQGKRLLIAAGCLIFVVLTTYWQVLPGTRPKPRNPPLSQDAS